MEKDQFCQQVNATLPLGTRPETVDVAVFDGARHNTPTKQIRLTYAQLTDLLANRRRVGPKDGKAVVFAELLGTRSNANVVAVSALGVDKDEGGDVEKMAELLRAAGLAGAVYETHNSTPENPKCRAVVPYAEPVTGEEHQQIAKYFAAMWGGDAACTDPARLFYLPSSPTSEAAAAAKGAVVEGLALDGRALAAQLAADSFELPMGTPARKVAGLNSDLMANLPTGPSLVPDVAALPAVLAHIDPDCARSQWWGILAALQDQFGDDAEEAAREWSAQGTAKFDADDFAAQWRDVKKRVELPVGKRVTMGTVITLARQGGWEPETTAIGETVCTRKFPNSDADMADRLADGYCGRLAYIEGVGWAAYDDASGVWKIDADGAGAKRAAIENARDMERAGVQLDDLEKRKTILTRALGYQSAKGVTAVLTLAQANQKLRRQVSEFDAKPWLLGLKNGVLDLKRGVLLPHSSDFCITVAAPVSFDATAPCPLWAAHIEMILPDPEVRRTLQQWFGLSLTGDISPQVFLYAFGWGKNGKSITFEVLRALLGPLSGWLSLKALMARAEDDKATGELMRMRPFRAGIANEVEEGQMLNESALKNIGGDEVIRARGNHKDPVEYRNQTKLTIVGNHLPVVRGADDGFWRRLLLTPFEVQIPEEQRDLNVREKLTAELPGILNWAVAGLADYLGQGRLYIAPRIKRAVAEFRGESDVLGQWVDERLEPAPGEFLANPTLYDDARNWFASNGFGVPSSGKLGRRLKEKGFAQGRGTRGERGWANVRLRLRRGN